MPKKIKLNLEDLKVQSFVTSLKNSETSKAKGGATADTICYPFCTDECTDTEVSCTCYTCPAHATCIPACTTTGGGETISEQSGVECLSDVGGQCC